jgi:hypothetical protein
MEIGDEVQRFSCRFEIPRIIPYIEYFIVHPQDVMLGQVETAELSWSVVGRTTRMRIFCDGPSYCIDNSPITVERPYDRAPVPANQTTTFEFEVCNLDIDYCTTERAQLIVR